MKRIRHFYEALTDSGPYTPDAASAGRRSLRNACLDLLAAGDPESGETITVRGPEKPQQVTPPVPAPTQAH